jgi:hypothetical protein
MYIPRLLVLFFLVAFTVALCVVPLSAQSARESSSTSSEIQSASIGSEFSMPLNEEAPIQARHLQLASDLEDLSVPVSMPDRARPGEDESNLAPRLQVQVHRMLPEPALSENESTCYFLRSYRVTRDDPDSDSTSPAGYSTCLPGTRVQMKSAVDSRDIEPR